jgi:hypothetical protein
VSEPKARRRPVMEARNDAKGGESKRARVDAAVSTLIQDLKESGELSEDQLAALSGGFQLAVCPGTTATTIKMHTYTPNSTTFNDDQDYSTDCTP